MHQFFGGYFFNLQRHFDKKGLIIAIIGIDGAGKSTIVRQTHDIISKKIDCETAYFGHGASGGLVSKYSNLAFVLLGKIFPIWKNEIMGIESCS